MSHGCNTGLLSKYNLAIGQQFADNQGVPFEGQKGGANFSTREDYRGWSTRVDNSSTDVYLWSFGPDATSKFGRAKNVKVFVPKE